MDENMMGLLVNQVNQLTDRVSKLEANLSLLLSLKQEEKTEEPVIKTFGGN